MRITVLPVTMASVAPALASTPPSDDDLAPGSLAGEYQIEKKIGQGGMGAVYGARHPVIGKRAAIKVIRRDLSSSHEAVDRFIREAQSVNQIGDPNIVDVFGFGRLPDGRSFFVMEWLQGESLRERLQRPLPFPDAIEILETIAKALQAAHEAGVVHRDLKPDNVFLAQQRGGGKPTVKLLDFGLAKLSGPSEGRMDHTRTGVVMGTPLYLSPEQAKGVKVDSATDVYSLGAMAYEMCSGVVPFKADSAVETMAMHISNRAAPLTELAPWTPPQVDRLVLGMLEKDPRARPTIAQVREQLAACRSLVGGMPTGMSPQQASTQPPWTPSPSTSGYGQTPAPGSQPRLSQAPGSQAPLSQAPLSQAPSQSVMAPPKPNRRGLWIGLAAVAAIGIAVGIVFAFGGKNDDAGAGSGSGSGTAVASVTPPKADPPKVEPPKVEPPKAEPPKVEPPKVEPPNVEPPTTDVAKAEPPKVEPPKVEPPKADPPKVTPPKHGRLGTVVVTIEGAQRAVISIDGKVKGRQVAQLAIELEPGDHVVHAEAQRHKPADATVHVDAGSKREVKLTLVKNRVVNAVHDPFDDN
jgi:serine/threonine-protein kinase